jgi:hypothetical protein
VVVLRPLGSEYAAGVVCSANCLEARSASEARARLGAMERWDARAGAPAAEGDVRKYIRRRWDLGPRLSFELLTYGGERLVETWRWCVAHGNCEFQSPHRRGGKTVCEFAGRTWRFGRLRVVWWPPFQSPLQRGGQRFEDGDPDWVYRKLRQSILEPFIKRLDPDQEA